MKYTRAQILRLAQLGVIVGCVGVLAGCHGNNTAAPANNPSTTPPTIMQSEQQNAVTRTAWLKSHLDAHGVPIQQPK